MKVSDKINGKMSKNTHVIFVEMEPTNYCPPCMPPEVILTFWSDDVKEFIKLFYDKFIPFNLLFQFSEDDDFMETGKELNIDNVIEYLNNILDEDNKNNLLKLKEVYNKYYDKDIDYVTFIEVTVLLEQILDQLGILFEVHSYYTPLECRFNENLITEEFDKENLESNFSNDKDCFFI